MSRNDIKYSILEQDGIDYDGPVEHIPNAKDIAFSRTNYTSDNVEDAIDEGKEAVKSILRFTIQLIYNGTVSNGDYIGYAANMSNKKIIFPRRCLMTDFVWQNGNTDVSFDLEIYKNGLLPANLSNKFEIRNGGEYGIYSDCEISFEAGDWIQIKYVDQGTNANDMVISLMGRLKEAGEA